MQNRADRPSSATAGHRIAVVLLATLVCACAESSKSSQWRQLVLEDAFTEGASMTSAQHARTPPHWKLAGVARAPLLVRGLEVEPAASPVVLAAPPPPLPPNVLLRIELRLLPAIDCSSAPAWLMESRDFAHLQPLQASALASLGTPEPAQDAWIVPAYVAGSRTLSARNPAEADAEAAEAALSGRPYVAEMAGVSGGTAFDFGPPWLGLPLRLAGPGAELLFPPSVDCAPSRAARDDTVPRRGFSQWAHRKDYISIPQNRPFLVSVVEVCPLQLRQLEEHYTVPGRWWAGEFRRERWRYTGELRADCPSGELQHRSEAIVIGSALGSRRLSDAYRTDIQRAPPPVW